MKVTHVRKGKSIQSIESRDIKVFDSINKAKKYSRVTFSLGELLRVDQMLPPLKDKKAA